jgi:hypothetical protein
MLTLWGEGGYGGSPNAEAGKAHVGISTILVTGTYRSTNTVTVLFKPQWSWLLRLSLVNKITAQYNN